MNQRLQIHQAIGARSLPSHARRVTICTMDTLIPDAAQPPETETERERRLAREAEGLARARASVAAGYFATSAEVNAWIDSLGSGNPLPVPYPRHSRPR